jgi:flavodoxin
MPIVFRRKNIMKALIVYDSEFGNTEHIALAVTEALRTLGTVGSIRASVARATDLDGVDLLLLGCPTQGWRATKDMQAFLDSLATQKPRGIAVACFDTRFAKPRWMTGSAAGVMAKCLRHAGLSPLVPAESFFVEGTEGPLVRGELERAATWARSVASQVAAPQVALR